MAQVISINVGTPRKAAWAGIGRTSIDKQPVTGVVPVGRLGLEGDQVSDTRNHGGIDQAIYAFAREDLDWWAGELDHEIRDGQFGENLTTRGIDVNAWVKRFALVARPGPYLRVIQEGEIQAGDELTVVHQPGHGVTVSTMFRALILDHSLLPELLKIDNFAGVARRRVEKFVGDRV